jgi:HlyD family secretion protein
MNASIKPAVVGIVSIAVLAACQPDADGARVVGQLESDRVELVAEFSEPIVERWVTEGEQVAAGDRLLQLDDTRVAARVAELDALLGQQRARLDELTRGPRQEQIDAERANVTGARRELDFRRVEHNRAQDVFEKKLAAPETLDRAKSALDAAEATLRFRESRLAELLAGTTVEELRQAESAVQQAQARLAAGRVDLERHTLVAPVDGIVDSMLFEVGERPVAGMPTLIMLAGEQPFARAYVPEVLRARVRPGAEARVYVDGIADAFTGRVRWIASEAAFTPYFALTERDRGRLTYFAKVDIIDAGDRLVDGVPVEVDFLLQNVP